MYSATQSQPTLGVSQKLTGTSFAVLMMDLDIPTNSPPQTSTLLHWMQTGLTQAPAQTAVNTTGGTEKIFLLQNANNTAAFAPYLGPSPPARVPLSHRYTQILVDMTGASAIASSTLRTAAQNRSGFDAEAVLTKAGLAGKVIAGNFFNVTNAGPAESVGGSGGGSSANATGGNAASTSTSSAAPGATTTFTSTGRSLVSSRASSGWIGCLLLAAVPLTY